VSRGKHAERSERTRAALLDAAESEFAEFGFAGARVDSIARAAGIRRASLFYHYPDKATLYRAVLDDRIGPYFEQVGKLLEVGAHPIGSDGGIGLIVQGVSAHAEFMARNPKIARIFLREITGGGAEPDSHLARLVQPLVREVARFLEARAAEGRFDAIDPVHLITAVVGTTLLHVAAGPILDPDRAGDVLDEVELARHKAELARMVERLLGIRSTEKES
jgi:TetR/AcrR family transcriptional regulator